MMETIIFWPKANVIRIISISILLEPGDLFAVDDFRIYLETGKLKYPVATYYKKNGW